MRYYCRCNGYYRPDEEEIEEEKTKYDTCYEHINAAVENNELLPELIKMMDNTPGYCYYPKKTQDYRNSVYLKTAIDGVISLQDFQFLIEKYDIRIRSLLRRTMMVGGCRKDIFAYLVNRDEQYYLREDYNNSVDLVLSALTYDKAMINQLLFKYKIDIWNPPEHINRAKHFGRLWRELIYLGKGLDTIKTFLDYGGNVNMWFAGWDEIYGVDETMTADVRWSPLNYAIGACSFKVAKYLMLRNAQANDSIFPETFAAVRYSLYGDLQDKMINLLKWLYHRRKEEGDLDPQGTLIIKKENRIKKAIVFAIHYCGSNPQALMDKEVETKDGMAIVGKQAKSREEKMDIYEYIDHIMSFNIEQYLAQGILTKAVVNRAKFEKWHKMMKQRMKDLYDESVSEGLVILKSNRQIVAKSMDMVMKLMVMSGQIRSDQILSGNILSVVMNFHGGLGDEFNPEDLHGLEILLEKRQFLLSHKFGHKKHYKKLGFLEKKGGILYQKEGNLGQKKCDLPAIDVENEQNMSICTEEVCKNVQKTVKNSTFLNNLDAVKFYLSAQHHNVRSVAFNTMSAMLDNALIAQAEWYVHEGRAFNTLAAAVVNGDVTVVLESSAINEAIHIAEIAVSPDSEANLGREATSHIIAANEAFNDDIIVHSDDILSQAMDLIHNLHFDTSLITLSSTTPYIL